MTSMDRDEIMSILPHRDDMLLLDEAILDGEVARAKYRVRGDEWFLRGHFPQNPVVPGVILCEILAQSACVLLEGAAEDGRRLTYYTGIDRARFRFPVRPGETIETECRITKSRPPFYFAGGTARVGGKVCLQADFSFAVMSQG